MEVYVRKQSLIIGGTEDGGDDDVIGTPDYYGPEDYAEMIAKGMLPLTDEERNMLGIVGLPIATDSA